MFEQYTSRIAKIHAHLDRIAVIADLLLGPTPPSPEDGTKLDYGGQAHLITAALEMTQVRVEVLASRLEELVGTVDMPTPPGLSPVGYPRVR